MPTRLEVTMPQWGMGMNQGTIVAWHKETGEQVEEDEPLVEIESEKTTDDHHSPYSGLLVEILVRAGETVSVGTVLAYIEEPD